MLPQTLSGLCYSRKALTQMVNVGQASITCAPPWELRQHLTARFPVPQLLAEAN